MSSHADRPWPESLHYEPQEPVGWLDPAAMARGGYYAYLSALFNSFADNRESQAALRPPVAHHRLKGNDAAAGFVNDPLVWNAPAFSDDPDVEHPETLWVDYVADLGDGFNATYTVAHHLARHLRVDRPSPGDGIESHELLPPGDLIIMGGDQVYPDANSQNYKKRTIGPYRTAFGADRNPKVPLFAIPGNHDWYDGLAAFLSEFTIFNPGSDEADKRAWTKHQTRSYFSIQLSDKWWLWGIDIALDAHIDEAQLDYFTKAAAMLPDGSRLILCTAKPAWLKHPAPGQGRHGEVTAKKPGGPDDAWDRLRYFVNTTVRAQPDERDLAVRLILSGDKHFYAHHRSDDPEQPELVVSGGGGAYLSSTLEAPKELAVPAIAGNSDSAHYRASELWPSHERSKRLALDGILRIPIVNRGLPAVFATLYALLAWAALAGGGFDRGYRVGELAELIPGPRFGWEVLVATFTRMPGIVLWLALGLACFGLASARKPGATRALVATAGHMALHLVAFVVNTALAALVAGWVPDAFTFAAYLALAFFFGSLFGTAAFIGYLQVAQFFGFNLNELFAGMAHEDYKGFVRLKVTDDEVTVYAIGFERVPSWKVDWSTGRPEATPSFPVEPVLIEDFPIGVGPTTR